MCVCVWVCNCLAICIYICGWMRCVNRGENQRDSYAKYTWIEICNWKTALAVVTIESRQKNRRRITKGAPSMNFYGSSTSIHPSTSMMWKEAMHLWDLFDLLRWPYLPFTPPMPRHKLFNFHAIHLLRKASVIACCRHRRRRHCFGEDQIECNIFHFIFYFHSHKRTTITSFANLVGVIEAKEMSKERKQTLYMDECVWWFGT